MVSRRDMLASIWVETLAVHENLEHYRDARARHRSRPPVLGTLMSPFQKPEATFFFPFPVVE